GCVSASTSSSLPQFLRGATGRDKRGNLKQRQPASSKMSTIQHGPFPEETGKALSGTTLTDRDVLLALYNATGGAKWRRNDNWNTVAGLGRWYGVEANGGRVVKLCLSDNNLRGHIPPLLGTMGSLKTLDLSFNSFHGPIPEELGGLTALQTLDLRRNQLAG
ncbi:unnamed protein product, partial [Scytosiphon promiscuus]